jgi:hypothetical protein
MLSGRPKNAIMGTAMQELLRSNDMVLLSYVIDLLRQAGVEAMVFDGHMSVLEGSIGVLPRRIMVDGADENRARRLIREAGLANHLRPSCRP